MALWVGSYWVTAGQMISETQDTARQVGGAIGAGLGTGLLAMIWLAGAAILGVLALATRGKRIMVQETVE